MYQLNNQGAHIMDCCVSETYQCLAAGDGAGKMIFTCSFEAKLLNYFSEEFMLTNFETNNYITFLFCI